MTGDAVPLHFTVEIDGNHMILALNGEIDLLSRPSLAELLNGAVDGTHPFVDVDLAEVSFINATSLRVLSQACRRGARRGVTLTVRRPSPYLVSLLRRLDSTTPLLGGHPPAVPSQVTPSDTPEARGRRADERDRRADERERQVGEREEHARDLQLLNEERGRLLDERQRSVRHHEQWEDIREDIANERESKLDQRERDC
ncbi:STAS domain-containing protein [Actinoplanes awajinensis]|uniref:STAS domain-containing protein n=1 Tax=Actinoplanes awajinensis subsp. mycoplanecinus TaxID=135947 RepID=A0A101JBX5_9ACTN|nr:STAS domain-containing protein [Actinoplanes awajinensis]KUL23943.1 hypothetical protein ADL15_44830 [Actinoplanes awajinensis subsp. mycoplanecinus]